MNALDSINLSIEFVKQTVDPGGGGGEFVNAQTGDIAIWAILAILFVGVIAYCMFRLSRVFNSQYASVTAKHAKSAGGNSNLAINKAVLITAVVGLIASLSMTATNAIAASNNANNVDIQPDKIQVVVNEEAGTINDATFNFVNNSQNYYLFDKTTKMELTSEVEGLTVPEDWDLQLSTLNTDLYKGAPNGLDYRVPDEVVTLYPGQSAQATLKFNKGSADLAKKLIGKQVFSLTMIPDQYVVGVPTPQTGLTYDGTVHTAIATTDAYTVTGGSEKNAGPYQATVTLKTNYKWPDKTTDTKLIDWSISPRPVDLFWFTENYNYNGTVQHPDASVLNEVDDDSVDVENYSFPAYDDGTSAGDHEVIAASLSGEDKDNYTLEGGIRTHKAYTIYRKHMTITADNKEKAIDDEEDPVLTATVVDNVPGEEFVKDKDYELSCQEHLDPKVEDVYAIYVKVKGTSTLAKNYEITTKNGTLTIVDNKPTITPDSFTITYGDDYPELTATTKNLDEGFNLVKGTDFTLDRVTGDDYGEYKISVTLIETSTSVQHYGKNNIRLKEGLFTINQYSVPITWGEFTGSYTKQAQYPTATLTKAKATDVVSVKTYSPYDENYDCTSAGDQKCKVSELDGTSARNYSLDNESNAKVYTIDKADIAMTVSVAGGNVTKPKNYGDTELVSSYELGELAPAPSDLHITYQWYNMEVIPEVESPYIPIEGATSANYTIGKNDYLGTYSFSVKYNVTSDDTNFNSTEITSTGVDVSLLYMKMTFKDLQNDTTTDLYTCYGTDKLYDSETGTTEKSIPTASKSGYVFNGWFTASTEGTQVIDYKNSILKTAVEGYISSNGTWANTEEQTLYAGLYQINYLTFTNEADGPNEIIFKQNVQAGCDMNPILIRYSTNLEDWGILETDLSVSPTLATLENEGDKLYIAGYNPNGFSGEKRTDSFSSTGKFSVSGSLGTLIDFTKTSVAEVPNDLCFQSLFENCTTITASPNVDLSFTENTSGCYKNMFKGCTGLKKIQVGFKSWPEGGFDGWVEGLNTDGTCEFDCPAELDWKYEGDNFCPKEWHNSKGEAFWTVKNGNELHFYAGTEESPENPTRVLLDNKESSPYAAVAGNIISISFTEGFWNWADNLRSFDYWFSNMSSLTTLDVSAWPISTKAINIARTNSMFGGCTNLAKINSGDNDDWSASGKITSETSVDMFKGDTKLPSFDAEKVDISMAKSETLGGYFTIKNVLLKARFLDGSLDFFVNNELTGGTIYNVPLKAQAAQDVPWQSSASNISSINSSMLFKNHTDLIESLAFWFSYINSCNDFSTLNSWNTKNVIDLNSCFSNSGDGCDEIDLNNWDTGKVTSMAGVFKYSWFKRIKIFSWNTSQVETFSWAFQNSHVEELNLSSWDTSKVTTMEYMFNGINPLKTINLNSWVFDNCNNTSYMFSSSIHLDSIYVSNWKFKNISDASYMFHYCPSLRNIDVSNWDVSALSNACSMFAYCDSLQSIDVNDWNVRNLKNSSYMFYGCQALKTINLSGEGWKNAQNLEDVSCMFQNCTGIDTSFVADSWNFPKMKNAEAMFQGCSNVSQIVLHQVKWPACTNMNNIFKDCSNLRAFNFDFKTAPTAIADLSYAFDGCEKLQYVGNLGSLTMSSCKNVDYMFNGCKALTEIKCNSDTDWSKISGIGEGTDMFAGCVGLPGFNPSKTDVSMAKPTSKGGYFTVPASNSSQELNDNLQTNQDNDVAGYELDSESQTDEPKPESKDPESEDPDPVAPDPKKEEDKEAIDPVKPEEVYIEEVIE